MTDLSGLGATSAGVWTRAQALRLLSAGHVRALLRDGVWQSPMPGVYADGGIELSAVQRAVVATSGGAARVAMGRTAARVWQLPLIDDEDPATGAAEAGLDDVAVRSGGNLSRPLRRHRLTLAPSEVVRHDAGFRLTTVLRTLYDLSRLLAFDAAVCAADDALHRGLVTTAELECYVDGLSYAAGVVGFRAVATAADGRAESPLETLVRLLALPALPSLVPQVELWDSAVRLVARFDLADEAARFAVEADGRSAHAGRAADDHRRDRRTSGLGWATERVTWFEARRQQRQTVTRLVRAYDHHRAR